MSGSRRPFPSSKRILLGGSFILAAALAGAVVGLWKAKEAPPAGPGVTPALLRRGEALFATNCSPCHGAKGIGQNPAEPNGGYDDGGNIIAPALDGSAHAWHHPDELLFSWIKRGSTLAESPMRGWEGRMSDEEIWAVIRYFQSLWPERLRTMQQQRSRPD